MTGRVIGYFITFLFSMYLFFMYDGHIWTGLLILEILYPFCSGIFLRHMAGCVSVRFGVFPAMAECGKRFRGTFVLKNDSRIWGVKYKVYTRVKNHFSDSGGPGLIKYPPAELGPSGEQAREVELESRYAGTVEYFLEALVLYDMLGIFCLKIKLRERRTIGTRPLSGSWPLLS